MLNRRSNGAAGTTKSFSHVVSKAAAVEPVGPVGQPNPVELHSGTGVAGVAGAPVSGIAPPAVNSTVTVENAAAASDVSVGIKFIHAYSAEEHVPRAGAPNAAFNMSVDAHSNLVSGDGSNDGAKESNSNEEGEGVVTGPRAEMFEQQSTIFDNLAPASRCGNNHLPERCNFCEGDHVARGLGADPLDPSTWHRLESR